MMALELSNPVHLALKDDITQGKMDRVVGPRCQGGAFYHYGSAEGKTTDVKVWSIVISGRFPFSPTDSGSCQGHLMLDILPFAGSCI